MDSMKNEGVPDSVLIKNSGSPRKTVVFVGNGAIEGGWAPIRKVIDAKFAADKSVHKRVTNLRIQNRETFHYLALFSYKFKVARAEQFKKWVDFKKSGSKGESLKETSSEGLKPVIKTFLNMRKDIANEYQCSQTTLRVDPEIRTLIGNDACFITTNWDNTLWNDCSYSRDLIHMHGRCEHPDSLVVPTELQVEDTAYDWAAICTEVECQDLEKDFILEVVSTFRWAYLEALLGAHDKAKEWLEKANRIIIWGYSLADYDADINALIATHTSGNVDQLELIVVNTNPEVFERAIALTGIRNALHYNPTTKTKYKFEI